MESWRGLVSTLRNCVAHLASPTIRSLSIDIQIEAPEDAPSASMHPDDNFWTINRKSIHASAELSVFNSLRSCNIEVLRSDHDARLTCNTMLTAREIEHRICLIFEPWSLRGILTVKCYDDERTDEEIWRLREEYVRRRSTQAASDTPKKGSSGPNTQSTTVAQGDIEEAQNGDTTQINMDQSGE